MSITTMLLTCGGKSRRSRTIEKPRTTSTSEAAIQAPRTAAMPWLLPMTITAPRKATLVPITTGSRPPTGPTG